MTDYDLCELICETSEEFELYCKDKHCRKESCTILKHFPDADCSIAYVAYTSGRARATITDIE